MRTIIFWILLLLGVSAMLASCSTMHKNKSSHSSSLDSLSHDVAHEVRMSKDQSTTATENDIQKVGNIRVTLLYDTGKVQINTVMVPTGNEDKSAINKVINALVNARLIRAEIEANVSLTDKSKSSINNNKTDSTNKTEDNKSHVKKTDEVKTLNKEVKGISIWTAIFGSLWFWLIVAITCLFIFLKYKLSIMNLLKKIWPFMVAIMLFSCNNPDGKTYPADPEPSGWDHGVQTFAEYVVIKPTWGQAFYFSFKTGYTLSLVIGIILVVAAIGIYYAMSKGLLDANIRSIPITLLILAGGLAFIGTRPEIIHSDNSIKIEKSRYEASKGDLPALWEQLYSERRINGTSGK